MKKTYVQYCHFYYFLTLFLPDKSHVTWDFSILIGWVLARQRLLLAQSWGAGKIGNSSNQPCCIIDMN
jgi:hypothetical protein